MTEPAVQEPVVPPQDPGLSEVAEARAAFSLKFLIGPVFACLGVAAAIFTYGYLRSYDFELEAAKKAAQLGAWSRTRTHLENYLWRHPHSAEGRMLMAEACIKNQGARDVSFAAQLAREQLQQIKGSPKELAKARLQEGRLALFLQLLPCEAEKLLRESLKLDDSNAEAAMLMWQLLDLTGRHVLSDEFFWKAFELSGATERQRLLKDWFLSEFYPGDLHSALYQQMGIEDSESIPASLNLLVRYRETEPLAPALHAAIANHYRGLGNLKGATDLLKESGDSAGSFSDPFFVAVLFETLSDLGQFERAKKVFETFPEPHDGYLYWRSAALYHDYIMNDSLRAVECIREAMQFTPAKLDWGLMNREAACLRKLGRTADADSVQQKVEHLTRQILTTERTSELRREIHSTITKDSARKFVEFYREFGLEREVEAWNEQTTAL